jgi:transcriptional regulator with XRE-family HTH domain
MAEGLGRALEKARLGKELSRELLARELNLSIAMLDAIEREDWSKLPPGQERPVTRQVAERLGVDPDKYPESWEAVPGYVAGEQADPRRDFIEQIVMGCLTLGSVGLLLWLVIPGPRIRTGALARPRRDPDPIHTPVFMPAPDQAFPVLGEVMPEAPWTEEGTLVSLRTMDTCGVRIESEKGIETRVLQVSEPWRLRVKGPFALHLDNAGVVKVEVAGRLILHGQSVGEAWEARFGADGQRVQAPAGDPKVKQSAPDTDPDTEPGGGGQV